MNSRAIRADTAKVRQASGSYFVKLGGEPLPGGHGPDGRPVSGREGLGSQGSPARRRHHKRSISGARVFLALVLVGVGAWAYWASQRPGGVSGTLNSWVESVRGDVAKVSADPDISTARHYFSAKYTTTGTYPQMSEADLAGVGIGVGVTIENCSPQAIVIQGASGGGTASRLLLGGHDLGELSGKFDCPTDLTRPLPWKRK